ncbi:hypothetical protein AAW51_0836 [Caldimonas brevitalea]|uniref:Uncharacterized protein n=1 Tax=Caldimonas brevitalea TaxID=413882 RepID=A0A0G3BE08_9BURK|nr:hypothetical protein AAW51_0836 [Caldimonas brevitalea]
MPAGPALINLPADRDAHAGVTTATLDAGASFASSSPRLPRPLALIGL